MIFWVKTEVLSYKLFCILIYCIFYDMIDILSDNHKKITKKAKNWINKCQNIKNVKILDFFRVNTENKENISNGFFAFD